MDVFVGNLSSRTTMGDLTTLFKGFDDDPRVQLFDKQFEDGSTTRYAVVTIEPDKLALKAIKKLSGQYLKGNVIVLREYHHRSYNNERRAVDWRDKPWRGVERRATDRRRKMAIRPPSDFDTQMGIKRSTDKIDPDNIKIEARDIFARKH